MRVRDNRGITRPGRRPLIYADVLAIEGFRRIRPDAIVEVEVALAILAGDVSGGNGDGILSRVYGDGWVAHVVREPGRLRPRPRAWRVLRVEPTRSSR